MNHTLVVLQNIHLLQMYYQNITEAQNSWELIV